MRLQVLGKGRWTFSYENLRRVIVLKRVIQLSASHNTDTSVSHIQHESIHLASNLVYT